MVGCEASPLGSVMGSRRGEGAANSWGQMADWNTSRAMDMILVFQSATAFNADLGKWAVGSVTDMGDIC